MTQRFLPLLALSVLCIFVFASQSEAYTDYFEYISPRPGAQLVSKESTIILRSAASLKQDVDWPSSLTVRGAKSGRHLGSWTVADDGETFIFRSHRPFEPAEVVTVSVDTRDAGPYSFTFTVSPKGSDWRPAPEPDLCEWATPVSIAPELPEANKAIAEWPRDMPGMTVTVLDNPAEGFLFLTNRQTPRNPAVTSFLLIVDNDATPVFLEEMPSRSGDFRVWPGDLLSYSEGGLVHILDNTYTEVDAYAVPNRDGHDFQLLPNGHTLFILRDRQPVDMSLVVPGGDPAAILTGLIIQELDTSKNVVFEWRSWDHYEITDSVIDLTTPTVDYVHCNTIEPDTDGNLLIVALNLQEITKIDRQTGDIIWRLGQGPGNEFTVLGEPEFGYGHHDVRRQANGNITIFNNRTFTTEESRAVEYSLDEVNKVATMVWEYRHSPMIQSGPWGSAQRLPNGNTLISWGATGIITEVRPDGTKAFEMYLDTGHGTYRAYRFPWNGVAAKPTLWGNAEFEDVTLHFTKFGDPDVVQYHVYQGESPEPTTLVASTTENSILISDLVETHTYYFRVISEDAQQVQSPFSNEISFTIEAPVPAVSMTLDGQEREDGIHLSWQIAHGDHLGHLQLLRAKDQGSLVPLTRWERGSVDLLWTDRTAMPGHVYRYQLVGEFGSEMLSSNEVTIDRTGVRLPVISRFVGAKPNPFNPSTLIEFSLAESGNVRIEIHDLAGRLVRSLDLGHRDAGIGSTEWNGRDHRGEPLASGTYLARLLTPGGQDELKLTLLK